MLCHVTATERYVDGHACRADMPQFDEHEFGGDRKADSSGAGTRNDITPPASVAIGKALHVFMLGPPTIKDRWKMVLNVSRSVSTLAYLGPCYQYIYRP